jgi:glycosyltransferase involved in cell wall biosynthesis
MANEIPNVILKTNVKEKALLRLYGECSAGIFVAYKEDFGIVPFEFLAAGKGLIIVEGGGYEKLIKNVENVFMFKDSSKKSKIVKSINQNLELFLKQNKKFKKIKFTKLKGKSFLKNISNLLK